MAKLNLFGDKPTVQNTQVETKQEEKPNKVAFNFKSNNTLADKKSEKSKDSSGSQTNSGGVAFNFVGDQLPSPTAKKDATLGDAGNSVDSSTTAIPPSLEELGEMNINDFTFKEQPEQYPVDAVEKLEGAIRILHESIDNKQMVGQAVTIIMKTLADNPMLKDNLRERPEELGLMVEGLRRSYGTVVQTKGANKKKRAASSEAVNKEVEFLKGLDLGL